MAINITNFLVTAERAGLPVNMIRLVWKHYRTEVGDSNDTSLAEGTIYLSGGTVQDLRAASLGIQWDISNSRGEFKTYPKRMMFDHSVAVRSLYHEATHAYFGLRTLSLTSTSTSCC